MPCHRSVQSNRPHRQTVHGHQALARQLVHSLVLEIFVAGWWESYPQVDLDHVMWMLVLMVLLQVQCHCLELKWRVQVWLESREVAWLLLLGLLLGLSGGLFSELSVELGIKLWNCVPPCCGMTELGVLRQSSGGHVLARLGKRFVSLRWPQLLCYFLGLPPA